MASVFAAARCCQVEHPAGWKCEETIFELLFSLRIPQCENRRTSRKARKLFKGIPHKGVHLFFPFPSAVQHPSQITSFDFPVLAATWNSEIGKRMVKGYRYSIVIFVLCLACVWEECHLGAFVTHHTKSSNLTVFPCADGRVSCRSARATFRPSKHATDDAEVCEGRDTKEGERDHGREALPGLQCHLTSFLVSIDGPVEVVREAEVYFSLRPLHRFLQSGRTGG